MNRQSRLKHWRWPASGFAMAIFLISVCLPLLDTGPVHRHAPPGNFAWSNFTLDYWIGTDLPTVAMRTGILLSPDLRQAALNTITIALVRLDRIGPPRHPDRLCRGPHHLPPAGGVPAAGDVHALSRAWHRLCRRLPVAARGRARPGAGALQAPPPS